MDDNAKLFFVMVETMSEIIEAFRVNMERYNPDHSDEDFDEAIQLIQDRVEEKWNGTGSF